MTVLKEGFRPFFRQDLSWTLWKPEAALDLPSFPSFKYGHWYIDFLFPYIYQFLILSIESDVFPLGLLFPSLTNPHSFPLPFPPLYLNLFQCDLFDKLKELTGICALLNTREEHIFKRKIWLRQTKFGSEGPYFKPTCKNDNAYKIMIKRSFTISPLAYKVHCLLSLQNNWNKEEKCRSWWNRPFSAKSFHRRFLIKMNWIDIRIDVLNKHVLDTFKTTKQHRI